MLFSEATDGIADALGFCRGQKRKLPIANAAMIRAAAVKYFRLLMGLAADTPAATVLNFAGGSGLLTSPL
ncbi:MAG: hypothetical protein DMF40_08085 [Verrucomicrobia bacterium]|nr:MAG: hypothetical protein DMF40_08085 [Verrucomicrobiota bacterium]